MSSRQHRRSPLSLAECKRNANNPSRAACAGSDAIGGTLTASFVFTPIALTPSTFSIAFTADRTASPKLEASL